MTKCYVLTLFRSDDTTHTSCVERVFLKHSNATDYLKSKEKHLLDFGYKDVCRTSTDLSYSTSRTDYFLKLDEVLLY